MADVSAASTPETLFYSLCETYFQDMPDRASEDAKRYADLHPGLSPQLCGTRDNSSYFEKIAGDKIAFSAPNAANQRVTITAPLRNAISASNVFFNRSNLSESYAKTVDYNGQAYRIEAERRWETPSDWMPFGFYISSEPSFYVTIYNPSQQVVSPIDAIILVSGLLTAVCPHPQIKKAVSHEFASGPFAENSIRDIVICN